MAITNSPSKVSESFHQAVITIDEKGTEAAAGTYEEISPLTATSSIDFIADHPFMFLLKDLIYDNILFLGCVNML